MRPLHSTSGLSYTGERSLSPQIGMTSVLFAWHAARSTAFSDKNRGCETQVFSKGERADCLLFPAGSAQPMDGRADSLWAKLDRATKPIEAIEVGDLVWAWYDETGEIVKRPVNRLFRRKAQRVVEVACTDENGVRQVISATLEHPFWIDGKGWVAATDLQAGDLLRCLHSSSSRARVLEVADASRFADVYNFEVTGLHNYFVGGTGVLVHNASHDPGRVPKKGPEIKEPIVNHYGSYEFRMPEGLDWKSIHSALLSNKTSAAALRRMVDGRTGELPLHIGFDDLPEGVRGQAYVQSKAITLDPWNIYRSALDEGIDPMKRMVLTLTHEMDHIYTYLSGIGSGKFSYSFYDEYRANVKEFMVKTNRRPNLEEKRIVWNNVKRKNDPDWLKSLGFPEMKVGKNPFLSPGDNDIADDPMAHLGSIPSVHRVPTDGELMRKAAHGAAIQAALNFEGNWRAKADAYFQKLQNVRGFVVRPWLGPSGERVYLGVGRHPDQIPATLFDARGFYSGRVKNSDLDRKKLIVSIGSFSDPNATSWTQLASWVHSSDPYQRR